MAGTNGYQVNVPANTTVGVFASISVSPGTYSVVMDAGKGVIITTGSTGTTGANVFGKLPEFTTTSEIWLYNPSYQIRSVQVVLAN